MGEIPPGEPNTNGGGTPIVSKVPGQEAPRRPKTSVRDTSLYLPLCQGPCHGLGVHRQSAPRWCSGGWGRQGIWGSAAAWGRRLRLGSRADLGESSHMALMKSTTSLPPPSPGTLQAPADAMPRQDNCFCPSLKGQLLLQLQTSPRPLTDPTELST